MSVAIGCDIGGSHISCAAVNMETGTIIPGSRAENDVAGRGEAEDILQAWSVTIQESMDKINREELAGIGFAMPGPFDYENGIAIFETVPKFENLYGMNIGVKIRERLGLEDMLPVRFMNDATSFAVAEAWIGKTSTYRKSIAITLGTGYGSAFIDDGIPVLEGRQVPKLGCLWHLPYKDGIADEYFSTRWFVNTYEKKTGVRHPGAREIAELAGNGDKPAIETFREFGENLADNLAPWVKSFGCEAIVAGGNISEAGSLWEPSLQNSFKEQSIQIPVFFSELKEDAAIIGSARLMEKDFWEKIKPLLSKM